MFVTLLPKSITTAIGMGVSEELNGIVTITVAVIIITGVVGNVLADFVYKLFHVTHPVAKGVGLGTSAHAIGTAKALEMGEIEGAMGGLSIAVVRYSDGYCSTYFSHIFSAQWNAEDILLLFTRAIRKTSFQDFSVATLLLLLIKRRSLHHYVSKYFLMQA